MKVLMQGRVDLNSVGGGDRIQIEHTAKELRKLGVEVDISTDGAADYSEYDLIHIFQLDWITDSYFFAKKAKKLGKPVVLSPIHHNVDEVKRFDNEFVFDFRRISRFLFRDQFCRDTFKNVYRALFSFRKIGPTLFSVIHGLKKMHIQTLEMSDIVLVQTVLEAEDLMKTYGTTVKWKKVPNGAGAVFLKTHGFSNQLDFEDYILCVGRIEPRKNQLNIIEAVKLFRQKHNSDVKLVFIGRGSSKKHFEYLHRFGKKLKENPWATHIVEWVDYKYMPSYYHFSRVCVSASWFETTGLTSLEALVCGTNAVASGDRAREYLGEDATYCDPADIQSIANAIEKEYFAPRPHLGADKLKEYTWGNAARKTLEVYEELLR